ncbi:MAG: lipoate--protein ligase family protein [Nitrospinota bacterium]|nr:lipoate--protein ligase family protein [Nitrospinota bacterium]
MDIDRAMLAACHEGNAPPTLRLYGWSAPTLTVGYSQRSWEGIDREKCRELNIPVVLRPTGGRALLHHSEMTYSIVSPIPHASFPCGLMESHKTISGALLMSLAEMGMKGAKLAPTRPPLFDRKTSSPACFASRNHCEIVIDNKKLIGSAQRRTNKAFLQHGSVLIDCDLKSLNSLFEFNSSEDRTRNLEALIQRTTTLNELLEREVAFEEVMEAFKKGFQKFFVGQWQSGQISSYEKSTQKEQDIPVPGH